MTETKAAEPRLIFTYKAQRPLRVAGGVRDPGKLWPEGALSRRVGSSVHLGRAQEVWVPESEFRAAVEEFVTNPSEKARVYERAGLEADVELRGPQRTPSAPAAKMVTVRAAEKPATRLGGTKRSPAKVPAKKAVKAIRKVGGGDPDATPRVSRKTEPQKAGLGRREAPAPRTKAVTPARESGEPQTTLGSLLDDDDVMNED